MIVTLVKWVFGNARGSITTTSIEDAKRLYKELFAQEEDDGECYVAVMIDGKEADDMIIKIEGEADE